jgi:hypothetical protein
MHTLAIQMNGKHMDNLEEAKRELEQVYARMLHENRRKQMLFRQRLRTLLKFIFYLTLIASILYGINTKPSDVIPTISGNGHFDFS